VLPELSTRPQLVFYCQCHRTLTPRCFITPSTACDRPPGKSIPTTSNVYHVIRQSKPGHLDLEDLSLLPPPCLPASRHLQQVRIIRGPGRDLPMLRSESQTQLFAAPNLDTIHRQVRVPSLKIPKFQSIEAPPGEGRAAPLLKGWHWKNEESFSRSSVLCANNMHSRQTRLCRLIVATAGEHR
jgi:hypothetical protein